MITIKNCSFGYKKDLKVFDQLSLEIKQGGVCGVLGKNGAGKTTLLNLITGLLFPDTGNCVVMGHDPRQRIPSVFEDIYFLSENLFVPPLTIEKYVTYYAPFYTKFDYQAFKNGLSEFALPEQKLLTTLSYGQKKKFLIAFGIATNSRLLILDEPTNGLDIPSKAQFRKLLASTIAEDKLIIISTHQVHDIENLIDSVLILDEGKNIFYQSIEEIAKNLSFFYQQQEPNHKEYLHYEKQLGGYTIVDSNHNTEDTHIDLEVLFNAVLTNKNKIQQLFSGAK